MEFDQHNDELVDEHSYATGHAAGYAKGLAEGRAEGSEVTAKAEARARAAEATAARLREEHTLMMRQCQQMLEEGWANAARRPRLPPAPTRPQAPGPVAAAASSSRRRSPDDDPEYVDQEAEAGEPPAEGPRRKQPQRAAGAAGASRYPLLDDSDDDEEEALPAAPAGTGRFTPPKAERDSLSAGPTASATGALGRGRGGGRGRGRGRGVACVGGGAAEGVSGSSSDPIILTSPQKKRMEVNRQAAEAKRAKAANASAAAPAAVPFQDADSSAAPGRPGPRMSPRLAKAPRRKDHCGGCGIHMPWDPALSWPDPRHKCSSCSHVVHSNRWICADLGRPDTTLIASEGFFYCDEICHNIT